MDIQTFWNEVGAQKDFEDPLYLEKLEPFIDRHSMVVEYGCGYGRLLQLLYTKEYQNLLGFDFASKMIERGKKAYPHLNLEVIAQSGKMPLENSVCDAIIMSTILCCVIDKEEQVRLLEEVRRVLKPGGVVYLSDFLMCDHSRYAAKYQEGYAAYGEWGIYTTSEGIAVRHHSTEWIMQLLNGFDIQWFEQFDFKTMNNNAARTFHCIAKEIK